MPCRPPWPGVYARAIGCSCRCARGGVTGIVLEVGAGLDAGGAAPRPILELLEARPLFDGPHLDLIEFLASYYMASLGEAYRSVIPATARVESRRMFHPARHPRRSPPPLSARSKVRSSRRWPGVRWPCANCSSWVTGKAVDAALNRLVGRGARRTARSDARPPSRRAGRGRAPGCGQDGSRGSNRERQALPRRCAARDRASALPRRAPAVLAWSGWPRKFRAPNLRCAACSKRAPSS